MATLTVYKYAVPIADEFTLDLPQGATPLHVETQRGRPALWCLVDPAAPIKARRFRLAGTGHPIHAGPIHRLFPDGRRRSGLPPIRDHGGSLMAKRYVDISFAPDGSFTIEATGFEGASCVAFTAPIEAALGSVQKRTMKSEADAKAKVKATPQKVKA